MNCYRETRAVLRWLWVGCPKRKYFPIYSRPADSWDQIKREHRASELRFEKRVNRFGGMAVFYGATVMWSSMRGDYLNLVLNLVFFGWIAWMHSGPLRVAWRLRRSMREMVWYFSLFTPEARDAQIAEFRRYCEARRWQP